MTREEINALLEAYRDGTITAQGGEALARLLDGGGEEAGWACAQWAVMGQLSQALDGVDGDAMVASFQERLRAETSGSRIVRGVERLRAADARGHAAGGQRARAQRRPRVLPGAMAAAALVLLAVTIGLMAAQRSGGLVVKPVPRDSDMAAAVTALSGTAERLRAGQASPVGVGAMLAPGDRLQVASMGAVALRYADGSELSLEDGAILEFIGEQAGKRLRLRAGALHAQVAHQREGAALVVETAFARCEVIGTTFAIDAHADSTRLTVYAGRVRMAAGATAGSGVVEVAASQYALAAPGTVLAVHDLAAPSTVRTPVPPPARLLDGFEQESPWTHEPYSAPLAFARSQERAHAGAWSLRIDYQRDVSDRQPYAQILHPLVLQPAERTIRLWMLVASRQEDARWQLQLHDRDNCYWKTAIRTFDAAPGWHELRIAIPPAPERAFAPPGHEGDPFVRDHVDAMALNFFGGDAVLFIDDIELLAEP
jgi:ferric-dicitrate binding protein FerR (iron transport regulator)